MKNNRPNTRRHGAIALPIWFFISLTACNIEVGNPDTGDAPMPLMRRLSVSVVGSNSCETSTATDCFAAPVKIAGGDVALSYEITSAKLSLATTQLKPQAAEGTRTTLDLLQGATIDLQSTDLSQTGGSLVLGFEPAVTSEPVLQLQGYLSGNLAGVVLHVPMTVIELKPLAAETLAEGGDPLLGVAFDASQWLDFSDQQISAKQLLEGLTSGACRTAENLACTKYSGQVSRIIAEKVMRSMRPIRQTPKTSTKPRLSGP